MKVEITMEKTMRVVKEFDVTEEELNKLKHGENPFVEEMEKEIYSGDVEYDYAVNSIDGSEIVSWR